MRTAIVTPTGRERTFPAEDIIVSKTDPKGFITYANDVFLDVSRYTEAEIVGSPQSIVRHPAMPRCLFRMLWEMIKSGEEMFAYIQNLASDGAHYWVLAHVTPSFDDGGNIVGYHSNRRSPSRSAVRAAEAMYALLRAEEARRVAPVAAMDAGAGLFATLLAERAQTYDTWVWAITDDREAVAR